MHGLEFRHTPNLATKGLWRFDYLKDKKEASETDEDSRFQGDGLIRPNTDRFWLRGKFNGYLFSPEWKTKIDLDLVSDQNYLREFDNGLSGFKRSRKEFLKQFGRDIEDNDDLTRTNTLSLSRTWTDPIALGLDARIVYTQNLEYANNNLDPAQNPTLQRLPELNLDIYKTPIAGTPFEFEARNQLVYFWREYGTRGYRVDLHPKISLPIKTDYLTIIPGAGWRQTIYFIDKFENDPAARDTQHRQQSRGIYDLSLSANTELFRVYDLENDVKLEHPGQSEWTKIKHTITPKIDYTYIPEKDQEDLPDFDSVDRIQPEDELTYSLVNLFTRRKDTLVADAETNKTIVDKNYLLLETSTILASIFMLRKIKYPFLILPIAFSLWFMSMDITELIFDKLSFENRRVISLIFGFYTTILAYYIDNKKSEYSFWLYTFGVMMFWSGLTFTHNSSEIAKFIYFLINIVLLLIGVVIKRKVFLVFGSLGVIIYFFHLSELFRNSFIFVYMVTFMGIGFVWIGSRFDEYEEKIRSKLNFNININKKVLYTILMILPLIYLVYFIQII
jgi:hypothetical protein